MVNNVKVGDTVLGKLRPVTDKELSIAEKLGIDVKLVSEDINGTGTVMILTDLTKLKTYVSKWKSWSPSFFAIGAITNGKKSKVSVSGSGYNKNGQERVAKGTSDEML
jgi:hypothetical protein